MENFIQKKSHLNTDEINELLYYYKQGITMGKEELMLSVINNMLELDFDTKVIAKVVNKTEKEILNILK